MFTIKINRKKRDLLVNISFDSKILKRIGKSPWDWFEGLFSQQESGSTESSDEGSGENQGDPSPTPPDEDDGESVGNPSPTPPDEDDGESQGDPSPTPPDED